MEKKRLKSRRNIQLRINIVWETKIFKNIQNIVMKDEKQEGRYI
jgi:hypothetical protein